MSVAKQNISFTAHYTGQVWLRAGWSHPAFATATGRVLYRLLAPIEWFGKTFLGQRVEDFLLQRHALIDRLLLQQIHESDSQILEVACGLSPRGYRFLQRYPQLSYTESDLREMADLKGRILQSVGDNRAVETLDILARSGDQGMHALCARALTPDKPLVIIVEGLLYYFDETTVLDIFERIADATAHFPHVTIIGDIYPRPAAWYAPLLDVARRLTALATRSHFHFLFNDAEGFRQGISASGQWQVTIHDPAKPPQTLPPLPEANPPAARESLARVFTAMRIRH